MSEREKLVYEQQKIAARKLKRDAQAQLDRQREHQIETALRRLDLVPLAGVRDAVMLRYRGWDRRIPDDSVGTLTKIGRTRGDVDFGPHGRWSVPLYDLIAASKSDERGMTPRFGAPNTSADRTTTPNPDDPF